MMKVYVFKSLPQFLWGYTRDIRAMWAIDDGGYKLTESGAILFYIAEKSGKLIPRDLQGRAQVYR